MARKPRNGTEQSDMDVEEAQGPSRPNDADQQLARFVDRVEDLEGQRRELAIDIREVLAQAKDAGFNGRAIRTFAKERLETSEEQAKRISYEEALADIKTRLGPFGTTPLGQAAVAAAASTGGVLQFPNASA